MDVLTAAAPLLLLIWLLAKPRPMPAAAALPFAAALAWFLRLAWFGDDPVLPTAAVVNGALTALTPLIIVWGAVLFFRMLEATGALDTIRLAFQDISPHPVARLMIIGWAFGFLVEGVSGFGTPAALAAPILVGLGFPALRVAALTLAMNSVPVTFGAIGTPIWFGYGPLDLAPAVLDAISLQAALINALAALVVPAVAMRLVIPWRQIREAWLFTLLTILATVIPYVLVAAVDPEFPAVIGGACGLAAGILLAKAGIGLPRTQTAAATTAPAAESTSDSHDEPTDTTATTPLPVPGSVGTALTTGRIVAAVAPFAAVIAILIITRIPALGIRGFISDDDPVAMAQLGSFASLGLSGSGALVVAGILGTEAGNSLKTLYVPGLLPLAVVALLTGLSARLPGRTMLNQVRSATATLRRPAVALVAAVALVQLLLIGGEQASARLIGLALADATGGAWPLFAPLLGAFGSFLSGSATVSNLTFGGIQLEIAQGAGLDPARILALQAVGSAMGNMVCIHNIVAVLAVLGAGDAEGPVLRTTARVLVVYALVAALAGLLL